MTVLVHLLSVTVMVLVLAGIVGYSQTSMDQGHFYHQSFSIVTESKSKSAAKIVTLPSHCQSDQQVIYDYKAQRFFKSHVQGPFSGRGNETKRK